MSLGGWGFGVSGFLGAGAVLVNEGKIDVITQIWDASGDAFIPARKMEYWTAKFGSVLEHHVT